MMDTDESPVEKLLNQAKSNGKPLFGSPCTDVDVKVDALAKLQAEFESGAEIPDVDAVLSLFKACLRTSNQHLSNATLNALPSLLPLIIARNVGPLQSNAPLASSSNGSSNIIDVPTLRQALSALLPSGGIVDRLGDKERAQAKAREALVLLGGYAFKASANSAFSSKSGKGPETPMMFFERVVKENGLASKVWKIKEQSILTLVNLRRAQPQFPIRPYLSLLVDCLEDTDAHVRDCARTSVVELFSGPYVTDAARADLKKELTKKNVRKTIVDGVLSKLLAASSFPPSEGSENGDVGPSKPKEYLPPSLMLAGKRPRVPSSGSGLSKTASSSSVKDAFSRPESRGAAASPTPGSQPQTPMASDSSSEVRPVYIASAKDLENEFSAMAKPFEGKETEHNWSTREQAIQRVRGMLKGDAHTRYAETFYACLKEGFMQWSLKTLASLRTTVAINTCNLYSELATTLGTGLDPFCDLLLTNLFKMAGFTKKLTAQQSQICVTDIITHTSAPSRIVLPLLWTGLQEKNTQSRTYSIAHLKYYLETHGARSRNSIEGSGGLEILEKSVKKALGDPNPAVRETSRVMFWSFDAVWHDSAFVILESLDATARKQLERSCPNPELVGEIAPTPKVPKKSSIAAAIAASRAKAKAIANAPPSLRHQATSSSQTPVARRAGSPGVNTSPKSTSARPSSPLRMASTPGSPPSRTPGAQLSTMRSVSSGAGTMTTGNHARGSSGSKRARSPSLSDHQFDPRRRTSSPLATSPPKNTGTLRRAVQTALPASPPSSNGHPSPTPRPAATLRAHQPVANARQSLMMPLGNMEDESLLMAQGVPIPEGDTDSEDDHSMNLMSFSGAYEKMPGHQPVSPKSFGSKPTESVSNALSSGSLSDMGSGLLPQQAVVVEDALRARAEQAESAAERLLELVDENDLQEPIVPVPVGAAAMAAAVNAANKAGVSSNGTGTVRAKGKTKPAPIPLAMRTPVTPKPSANARATAVMKQAAMFRDSPVATKKATSLLDVLQAQRHETGWWLKRTALMSKAAPLKSKDDTERIEELESLVATLESGQISKDGLQRLALICSENTVSDLSSPPPSPGGSPSPFTIKSPTAPLTSRSELWDTDRIFSKLFNALMQYLEPSKQEDDLEYALIIIWEMLENQGPYLEGREADLFSMLLRVRYCNKVNVLEATSTIRDALTTRSDPVYGLTTFHGCLKSFQVEQSGAAEAEVKAVTVAFGLIALGKFILRLPAEIAEEELPRLKGTLISALNDRSSLVVRESAAAAIISAQLVLKDETQLFGLLDGLADDKKNLLTYLFDKHGARGVDAQGGDAGIVKFQKEIRRLDTRTSTPMRGARA